MYWNWMLQRTKEVGLYYWLNHLCGTELQSMQHLLQCPMFEGARIIKNLAKYNKKAQVCNKTVKCGVETCEEEEHCCSNRDFDIYPSSGPFPLLYFSITLCKLSDSVAPLRSPSYPFSGGSSSSVNGSDVNSGPCLLLFTF